MVAAIAEPPKMLDVGQVADTLNCSPRHVWRLADGGQMPAPVKLGTLARWSSQVLTEWIASGCKPVRRAT